MFPCVANGAVAVSEIDAIINPQSFLRHHGDLGFAGHLADPRD